MTATKQAQRTPGPWELRLTGEQGTTIWSGNEIIAQIHKARSHHSTARADAAFIVRACNSHDFLLATLEEIADNTTDPELAVLAGFAIGKAGS